MHASVHFSLHVYLAAGAAGTADVDSPPRGTMRKTAKVTISICATVIAMLGMSSQALSDSPTQVDVRDNSMMSSCKKWTWNPGKGANVRCRRTNWKQTNYYVTAVCASGVGSRASILRCRRTATSAETSTTRPSLSKKRTA